MTFLYDSDNTKDNETRRFQPDSEGNSAVNVVSSDLVNSVNSLLGSLKYDAGTVSYPNATTEIYQFRVGGVAGTIVATVTLIYTTASKQDLLSWEAVVI